MPKPLYENLKNLLKNTTYSGLLRNKRIPKDYLTSLDEYASIFYGTPEQRNNVQNLDHIIKSSKISSVKKAIGSFYQKERQTFLGNKIDEYLKTNPIKGGDNSQRTFNFINNKIDNTSLIFEEHYRFLFSKIEQNLKKSDLSNNSYKMFENYLFDPIRSKTKYGFSEKDLFHAIDNLEDFTHRNLKNPWTETLINLSNIINTEFKKFVKEIEPFTLKGNLDNYKFPLAPSNNRILSLSVPEIADIFTTYTTLNKKQSYKLSSSLKKRALSADQGFKGFSYDIPEYNFRSIEGLSLSDVKYKFYQAIGGYNINEGSSLLGAIFNHKNRLLKKAYLIEEFGADPFKTISYIMNKQKKGKTNIEIQKINDLHEKIKLQMQLALGLDYKESSALRYYMSGIDKFTSATLGAGGSFLRNKFIDFSSHSTAMKNAFFAEGTTFNFFKDRFMQSLGDIPLRIIDKFKSSIKHKEYMNDLLNTFEFSTINTSLFKTQGFRAENFIGENIFKITGKTKEENIGIQFNSLMGKFNDFMHNITGNNIDYDSTAIVNLWTNAKGFSSLVLKHNSYEEFLNAIGPKGIGYLDLIFDIGEREFKALKQIFISNKKLTKENIKKTVDIGKRKFNLDEIITPQKIRDADINIFKEFRKKGETPEQFKKRLLDSYKSLLNHQKNMAQSTLTDTSRITAKYYRGSFLDLLILPFFKFFDIIHAQHHSARQGIATLLYGSPINYGAKITMSNPDHIKQWGKMISFYTAGAISLIWLKDMLNGRTPRDFNEKLFMQAMTDSGIGGIPIALFGTLIRNFHSSDAGYYSSAPLGTIIGDLLNSTNSPYKFSKFIKNYSGIGKIWWAKGIVDLTIRQAILDQNQRKAINEWYKNNLGSSFYIGN